MTNILIVEDEQKLARVLELELGYENYQTKVVHDGRTALEQLENNKWDIVLLDIMIPYLSGLEVLRRVRKTDQHTPILLLTARDEIHDKVSGLDLGANDYITKPFQIEELLARIRVHLRSNVKKVNDQLIEVGDLQINLNTREVTCHQTKIELTRREFDLLAYLAENENQVLTREQILARVWGYDYIGETNVVDVYIRYLRQKIDKIFNETYIHTIRGVGYSLRDSEK